MRFFDLRILGLVGALALLFSFGLFTQASPAAAASPGLTYAVPGPDVSAGVQTMSQAEVRDDSNVGAMEEAMALEPNTMVGFHLERRLKLRHHWTAEDGTYCTIKGGGQVFVPEGSTPETGLTC